MGELCPDGVRDEKGSEAETAPRNIRSLYLILSVSAATAVNMIDIK